MDKNKIIAGLVVIGIAVGVFAFTRNKEATCALTAAGAATVVAGVTHGRGVTEIVGTTTAGAVVPVACTSLVESLLETPSDTVSFELQLPTGESYDQTMTGTTLLNPPPSEPQPSILGCFDWDNDVLVRLCIEGSIPPPQA